MLPLVAIVGRPNVGKSTLFNCLTRTRAALVADEPGVTRDRQVGMVRGGGPTFAVIDTGGLNDDDDPLTRKVTSQALLAVEEADVAVLVVDVREGLSPEDEHVGAQLRRTGTPLLVAANKSEGMPADEAASAFHRLGFAEVVPISAAHRSGINTLLASVRAHLPQVEPEARTAGSGPRVAIVGRPNVGKSTLVNRLVGEDRVIAHDLPGTTRDSVDVPLHYAGEDWVLVDTAGIRRRARVTEKIERLGALKALQAIEDCDVVVVLVDGVDGITEQDLSLLGHVLDAGRALVVAVNKWDAVARDDRHRVKSELERRLTFVDFATVRMVSARRGSGLRQLFDAVRAAWRSALVKLPTPALTNALEHAVARHPPPTVRGRRIKLRYAHQGGSAPPRIVVHGNQTDAVPPAYTRYLSRTFREAFEIHGTPVVVEFRTADNPFRGKRNKLTPRQEQKRRRLLKHVKK